MTGSPGPPGEPTTPLPKIVDNSRRATSADEELERARKEQTMKDWEESPNKMFGWRSRMTRLIMLYLEEMICRDVGSSRTKENVRIRAIVEFQKVAAQMEEHRMDEPVVCPHCTKEFQLE